VVGSRHRFTRRGAVVHAAFTLPEHIATVHRGPHWFGEEEREIRIAPARLFDKL